MAKTFILFFSLLLTRKFRIDSEEVYEKFALIFIKRIRVFFNNLSKLKKNPLIAQRTFLVLSYAQSPLIVVT